MIQLKNSPAGFFFEDTFLVILARLIPASGSPDCAGTRVAAVHVRALVHSEHGTGQGGAGTAAGVGTAWFTPVPSPM